LKSASNASGLLKKSQKIRHPIPIFTLNPVKCQSPYILILKHITMARHEIWGVVHKCRHEISRAVHTWILCFCSSSLRRPAMQIHSRWSMSYYLSSLPAEWSTSTAATTDGQTRTALLIDFALVQRSGLTV
jgi:hypothetical protein